MGFSGSLSSRTACRITASGMSPVLDRKLSMAGTVLISDRRSLLAASGWCRYHRPRMHAPSRYARAARRLPAAGSAPRGGSRAATTATAAAPTACSPTRSWPSGRSATGRGSRGHGRGAGPGRGARGPDTRPGRCPGRAGPRRGLVSTAADRATRARVAPSLRWSRPAG